MAKLLGIAVRQAKKSPIQTLDSAFVSLAKGVEHDFRGKPSKRQVTLMSAKVWEQVNRELKRTPDNVLPWTTRRANFLVDDLDLENTAGQTIIVGQVKLLVTQETDPCTRMEAAAAGLFEALKPEWRGGVCCRVIHEGQIQVGDDVGFVFGPDE